MQSKKLDAMLGLAIGDAFGVPYEFNPREITEVKNYDGMQGHMTHNQPKGTWSDDTSLTLATLDSLSNGLDYEDMMQKFKDWFYSGKYAIDGKVFDIGNTTVNAIHNSKVGLPAIECGGKHIKDNGNGSLMRILPLVFYFNNNEVGFDDIVHNVSALTHAHEISKIACGIYISIANEILKGQDELHEMVYSGYYKAMMYYKTKQEFIPYLGYFKDIFTTKRDNIDSKGYVIGSLTSAIYALLRSESYKETIIEAVRLGGDTDTNAAIAGGLAGLYYGKENIPENWLNDLRGKEYIEELCNK